MKERFLLALSWGALAWFGGWWGFAAVHILFYDDRVGIFGEEVFWMFIAVSPVVWLTLWIVTGKSRILPWRK